MVLFFVPTLTLFDHVLATSRSLAERATVNVWAYIHVAHTSNLMVAVLGLEPWSLVLGPWYVWYVQRVCVPTRCAYLEEEQRAACSKVTPVGEVRSVEDVRSERADSARRDREGWGRARGLCVGSTDTRDTV